MGQYKTEAILLTVRDWDNADRMVTFFSREFGRISAVAYGARRTKSQLAGTVQPFVHADMVLVSGKSLDTIKHCEIRKSFRELRENLNKMAYAAFLAELAGELWPEREAEPDVFDLLLAALELMLSRNPRITALACALQLLAMGGFLPTHDVCVVCRKNLEFPAYFDSSAGGGVCTECAAHPLPDYSKEAGQFIKRLLELDWKCPGNFSTTGAALMQTERLLTDFITHRLDRPLKSLAFIAAVNRG